MLAKRRGVAKTTKQRLTNNGEDRGVAAVALFSVAWDREVCVVCALHEPARRLALASSAAASEGHAEEFAVRATLDRCCLVARPGLSPGQQEAAHPAA